MLRLLPLCAALLLTLAPARADTTDNLVCRSAIAGVEPGAGIPSRLLSAIAVVESGRRDPATGAVSPWPWTINVEGVGHLYGNKAEAVAAVQDFQSRGARSIDVGCMQVNLLHHPDAFASLEEAFDPASNARYAARFLVQLYGQAGTWPRAAGAYHSWTPALGEEYARKVLAVWDTERDLPASAPLLPRPATPFAAFGNAGSGRLLPMPGPVPGTVASATAGPGGGVSGRGLDDYRAAPNRLVVMTGAIRRF